MSDDERDNDIESDADKRAHHNALERKRRDHIKESFTSLRDALPAFQGDKASRAQILKRAADYIQTMRKKNVSYQTDIDDLKRQNKMLEEQIRSMEKTKTSGNFAAAAAVLEASHMTTSKIGSLPMYDDPESDSEDSSENSDESKDGPRKRLKSNTDVLRT